MVKLAVSTTVDGSGLRKMKIFPSPFPYTKVTTLSLTNALTSLVFSCMLKAVCVVVGVSDSNNQELYHHNCKSLGTLVLILSGNFVGVGEFQL